MGTLMEKQSSLSVVRPLPLDTFPWLFCPRRRPMEKKTETSFGLYKIPFTQSRVSPVWYPSFLPCHTSVFRSYRPYTVTTKPPNRHISAPTPSKRNIPSTPSELRHENACLPFPFFSPKLSPSPSALKASDRNQNIPSLETILSKGYQKTILRCSLWKPSMYLSRRRIPSHTFSSDTFLVSPMWPRPSTLSVSFFRFSLKNKFRLYQIPLWKSVLPVLVGSNTEPTFSR